MQGLWHPAAEAPYDDQSHGKVLTRSPVPTIALTEVACQVWTYNKRAAFVLSVTEKGRPVLDNIKLQRLHQILFNLVDNHDDGIINIKHVSCRAHAWRAAQQDRAVLCSTAPGTVSRISVQAAAMSGAVTGGPGVPKNLV